MQTFIDIIIYFIAIMGILITTISFFDRYTYSDNLIYCKKIYTKKNSDDKFIEIIVNTKNLSNIESEKLLKAIKKGEYTNIEDLVDSIKINKIH